MIFDEIDRGVGGAVASAIGERLARLAEKSQLLVVTHSPQVAARAAHHYRIEKSHGDGGTRDHGAQARLGRAARGNRADAVGRGNHRRGPRPGGAATGGSVSERSQSIGHDFRARRWSACWSRRPSGRARDDHLFPTVMGVQQLEIGFAETLGRPGL